MIRNAEDEEDRDCPVPSALKDDLDMLKGELPDKGPNYVLRILNGANVQFDTNENVIIRHEGTAFLIRREIYRDVEIVVEKLKREELSPNGVHAPFSTENAIKILYDAKKEFVHNAKTEAHKLRVFFMLQDLGGCGYYRVLQPVQFLNRLEGGVIFAEHSEWFTYRLGKIYDVIVTPRLGRPNRIGAMMALKEAGKVAIYETDDLLTDIPDWNPNKNAHTDVENFHREYMIRNSDGIIVSTPELKEMIGYQDITHVCENGINPSQWPMKVQKRASAVTTFMWAGTNTHVEDLKQICGPIRRMIKKFGSRVRFIFVGYLPDEFSSGFKKNDKITCGVRPEFQGNISYVPGCRVFDWSKNLAKQESDVCLAPLVQHRFNESKSELKVIEGWALGNAVIASDIAPYKRAIRHGENGLLVSANPDLWYNAMKKMVEDREYRIELAEKGLATLNERYLMEKVVEKYERAILTVARGRIMRAECNEAIERRLKEKGWA